MENSITVFGLLDSESQTTTSQLVADKFGKRHADMLRSIEKQVLPNISSTFAERNIAVCFKINELQNNRKQKYYKLTKDGFLMVAMSLTGKEAYSWKEAFISEFNRIEEENRIMQSIVWEVINGQAFLSQELALKSSGCDHPRLFMKFLKRNPKFYSSVLARSYLQTRQCNQHGDRWWKFSKAGFKWLVANKDILNTWVKEQKELDKLNKVLPA